jgi:hypothetical protein
MSRGTSARQWAMAVAIVICLLMAGAGQSADEILTNQLVIKLVTAGLSEGVIIEKIQSSPSRFDVDIDAMIALKGAGVPDGVIQAMVRARRGSQIAAPDPLSPTQTTPAPGGSSQLGGTPIAPPGTVQPPIGPFVRTPGVVGAALGSGLLPVLSSVPVEVKDTVVYIRDDKQMELEL